MSDFPYPGLRPFKRKETDIFFGREELTNQLIDKVGLTNFLAVVGVSGCGKSSVIRTGMLAGLESGFLAKAGVRWCIAELHPSNSPFTNLAVALLKDSDFKKSYTTFIEEAEASQFLTASLRAHENGLTKILQQLAKQEENPLPPRTNLLLVVDQFEELFRYSYEGKEEETANFVKLLLTSSQHPAIYVVISMRSEQIGECARFPGLPEAVNEGLFIIPRLTLKQLQQAIEGPAKVFGGQVESALTDCLLDEISQHIYADQLPVLQHALMRMWILATHKNPQQIKLTVDEHYAQIGELKNALSNHADEVYDEKLKTKQQQKIARILFINLCDRTVNERRDIRRPTALEKIAELAEVPWQQVVPIVEEFRQPEQQFITPLVEEVRDLQADTQLDVSHESFIRLWKRLQKWLEKESILANTYIRLEESAHLWEQNQAGLLQSPELENAVAWFDRYKPTKQWAERYGKQFELAERFLLESQGKHRKKQEEEKAKQKKELEQTQQLLKQEQKIRSAQKQILVGAVIALIISIALFVWAISERQEAWSAQKQTEIAKKQEENAKKQRAIGLFESELTYATFLARDNDYQEAKKILKKTYQLDTEVKLTRLPVRNILERLTDINGGTYQQIYRGAGVPLSTIAISPNRQQLTVGGESGTLLLFDIKTGQVVKRLQSEGSNIKAVVFDPKGKWLASAGYDGKINFWSLLNGQLLKQWDTPSKKVFALAISPNGQYLASGGMPDNNITLWDIKTEEKQIFQGHKGNILDLAFSPDGKWLASASADGTASLWQIETAKERHIFEFGEKNPVHKVAFSPNGQLLAASGRDKTIRLWEVKLSKDKEKNVLLGHKEDVLSIDFLDDNRLVSASLDKTLRLWDIDSGVTLRVLQGHTSGVTELAHIGPQIFSASNDGTVKRWNMDLPYQKIIDVPKDDNQTEPTSATAFDNSKKDDNKTEPPSVAIAPDGKKVAIGFQNGLLQLYSLPKAKLLQSKKAQVDRIKSLAFNPDGTLLASASYDETVQLWQVKNNQLSHPKIIIDNHQPKAVAFSPDGKILAMALANGQVHLLTVNTGKERIYQAYEDEPVRALSFYDNLEKNELWLLTTGDFKVRLWNLNNWPDEKPKLLQEYPEAKNFLTGSMLSPNGQQIASVGRDSLVHIYETLTKEKEQREGHKSTINKVIYSPQGQMIVTASADATLRFWDLGTDTDNELFTLQLPNLPYSSSRVEPLKDFDFRCTPIGCWVAVPLTRGKLILYELGDIYQNVPKEKQPVVEATGENKQFIPIPIYRTGPYAIGGSAIFGGFMDYMTMLNEKEGGINGVKLVWEECETAYEVERAIECYEKLKDKGATGAAMFNFVNTGATYAVIERATQDKIPVVSIGYGRSDTADGKIFKYLFPLTTTYWNQSTTTIKFIGQKEGGIKNLKGKTIANVYHHSGFGKETLEMLNKQATKYGFILKHFPIMHPGRNQQSTWKQIKRLHPDWIILRSWGNMTPIALQEAKRIEFPPARIVGFWWSGSEEDVIPAGDAAIDYITAAFHPSGRQFQVIQNIQKYVYGKGNGHVDEKRLGSIYYNRGIIHGILNAEAIRTAQAKFGHQPLTGEQVQWGLEHLDITEERLKELGAKGLFSPIKTSCENHEGGGKVRFQQWDGEKWHIISDWIAPDYELTRPMVEASAQQYAEEHGITPRDCDE